MLKIIAFKRLYYKTFTVNFITNLPLHGLLKTLGLKQFSPLFWYIYISLQLDTVPVIVHIEFYSTLEVEKSHFVIIKSSSSCLVCTLQFPLPTKTFHH